MKSLMAAEVEVEAVEVTEVLRVILGFEMSMVV